jgi:hypothetical protein
MIYDRTDGALSRAWLAGGWLYRALGRLDAFHGARSWSDALDWLAGVRAGEAIAEIQLWMHGLFGRVLLAREPLSTACLTEDHPLCARLSAIRKRMATSESALWWFRTCQTFGTADGHSFARSWARFFGCRVAGHTYDIGLVQSGLHILAPGQEPSWSVAEGLHPKRASSALASSLSAPSTITCLHGKPPGTAR